MVAVPIYAPIYAIFYLPVKMALLPVIFSLLFHYQTPIRLYLYQKTAQKATKENGVVSVARNDTIFTIFPLLHPSCQLLGEPRRFCRIGYVCEYHPRQVWPDCVRQVSIGNIYRHQVILSGFCLKPCQLAKRISHYFIRYINPA